MRNKWVRTTLSLVLVLSLLATFGLVGCGDNGGGTTGPTASFSGTPTLGVAPLTVQFTDESTGEVTSWKWDFTSDGSVDSTDQNPSTTYNAAGTYSVALTVTGPGGDDTEVKVGYIRVGELLAGFDATPTSGIVPLTVQFTSTSVGDITTYAWDFGDGNTSSDENPTHTFTTDGTYTVALTVTGTAGSNTFNGTIQAGAVPALTQQTWKLSHGFPDSSIRGQAAIKFKELIEAATGGKILVDIYPNGTLFSSYGGRQAVIDGSVEMTFDPPYYWGVNIPWIPWLYTWGLFSNWEHALGVFSDPAWTEAMQGQFEPHGVSCLGMTVESMFSTYINNKQAVTNFMEMAGWKEASYAGSTPTAGALLIGFDRVTISWGQEQAALIAGTIDVYSASVPTSHAQQTWTFADYSIAGSLGTGSVALVNQATWDAIPAYWQNVIMQEVMPELIEYAYLIGKTTEEAQMADMDANYVDFNVMSEAQMANFLAGELLLPEVKVQMYDAGEHIVSLILDWTP